MAKKVFVSGCYDLLHSGHVEFFQQASRFGDLYVGIGSDATYLEYKHRKPMFPQEERLFMVKNIKAVKDAYINEGSGVIDYLPTLDKVKPDVFVVNAEGGSEEKRKICEERGIEYVELQREPHAGLKARSSSDLKKALATASDNTTQEVGIPTRLDLAGTWIDQPCVSHHHLAGTHLRCARPMWSLHFDTQHDQEDMAGETAQDGSGNVGTIGVLL